MDDQQDLKAQLLLLSGEDKRVSCTDARKLACDQGVEMAVVGSLCDELGIKIFACELGCF